MAMCTHNIHIITVYVVYVWVGHIHIYRNIYGLVASCVAVGSKRHEREREREQRDVYWGLTIQALWHRVTVCGGALSLSKCLLAAVC